MHRALLGYSHLSKPGSCMYVHSVCFCANDFYAIRKYTFESIGYLIGGRGTPLACPSSSTTFRAPFTGSNFSAILSSTGYTVERIELSVYFCLVSTLVTSHTLSHARTRASETRPLPVFIHVQICRNSTKSFLEQRNPPNGWGQEGGGRTYLESAAAPVPPDPPYHMAVIVRPYCCQKENPNPWGSLLHFARGAVNLPTIVQ